MPPLRWLALAVAVGAFALICAQFYLPGKGFTYLVMFGEKQHDSYLPELRALDHYEADDSPGYDAQYYAQIAMHPQLSDPALRDAVDSLSYRARRILFCWTAYALALGNPERALNIYAIQNIVCWFVLAALLLRWFPPTDWSNVFRWFGVMFSFGLCFSVRASLVDGPSLLMIAAAVALAEKGRSWWSAGLLGIAGLGKETNILAGIALAEPRAGISIWRALGRWIAFALIVVLPLAAWLACLHFWIKDGVSAGARNFALPLTAYFRKWQDTVAMLRSEGMGSIAQWSVLMLITLTVQALFFIARPRWREAWWRVGATYTGLMIFLGDAVWEGYPGAASRVLLPMGLAFNILVPRGKAWWVVLLLGNLTLAFTADTLKPPARVSYEVDGPRQLRVEPSNGQSVSAHFDDKEWFLPERSRLDYWRWSRGSASVTLHNPHPYALRVDVHFGLKSADDRSITVRAGNETLWQVLSDHTLRERTIENYTLPPGDTVWRFVTDREPQYPATGDPRKVAFSLRNLAISIKGRVLDADKK